LRFGDSPPEQLVNGLQQLLAMAERYTETRQIIVGQIRQHVAVDRLIGEQGLVLAKPQFFKPSADVQSLHEIACPQARIPQRTCSFRPGEVQPWHHPRGSKAAGAGRSGLVLSVKS
jgi:hypothetical protein